MEQKELKQMAIILRQLGLSYSETVEVVHEMSKDVKSAQNLWRGEKKSKLIKIALTLITLPEPTPVSETVGAAVLVAGLAQKKIKDSALYVEDVFKTCKDLNKDIMKIRDFKS